MENEITDEYDKEFINLMMEVEKKTEQLSRHDQLRIKSWCKKLCQITNNIEWKKNRNLHAILLLDNILNERFEEPYNKFAPEGAIPIINKTLVKAKLSQKFLKNTDNIFKPKVENENKDFINIQHDYLNNKSINSSNHAQSYINSNNNNSHINPNNGGTNMNEQLKKMMAQFEAENKKKDAIIQKLTEDKLKYEKRIQELEKMLSTFMEMEKQK